MAKAPKPNSRLSDKREPPLSVGNIVKLNTGGYNMIVVDVNPDFVTVAWKEKSGKVREADMVKSVLHRVRDSW